MKVSPCKDCQDRCACCHDSCGKYGAWKDEHDKARDWCKRAKETRNHGFFNKYQEVYFKV